MGLLYASGPQPVPVDLVEVTRGALRVTVGEEGETRVDDVDAVSVPVAGRMLRIEGDVGDRVTTVVATLHEAEPAFLSTLGGDRPSQQPPCEGGRGLGAPGMRSCCIRAVGSPRTSGS